MRRLCVALAILVVALPGCTGGGDQDEITVLAAASLTDVFVPLAAGYEADTGTPARASFSASDGLATQIQQGAPADVFISASERWMDAVADTTGITERHVIATNRLAIVTPLDDPTGVASLEDLAAPGLRLVLAAEGVPAGDYARQALDGAGVLESALANLASQEQDVRGVLHKVLLGEADAGIVYVTDVHGIEDQVRTVQIPAERNVVAVIVAGVPSTAPDPASGAAFIRYLLSEDGQAVLRSFGFGPPG